MVWINTARALIEIILNTNVEMYTYIWFYVDDNTKNCVFYRRYILPIKRRSINR
jgi:hypothetical protein